jgi:hypothetical protein
MKERLLDIAKWGLIFLIAGAVFYSVCPKYYFSGPQGVILFRCNKITGYVEQISEGKWISFREVLNQKAQKESKSKKPSPGLLNYGRQKR